MLHKWKQGKGILLGIILVECICVLIPLLGLFKNNARDIRIEESDFYYQTEEKVYQNTIRGEQMETEQINKLYSESFFLPRGVYLVNVDYTRSSDGGEFCLNEVGENHNLKANPLELHYFQTDHQFTIWISGKGAEVQAEFELDGAEVGDLEVKSIEIHKSSKTYTRNACCVFLLVCLMNLVFVYMRNWKTNNWEQRWIPIFMFLCVMIVSIPLLQKGIPAQAGVDIDFHLLRMEGLVDGLTHGVFPVKIQPDWFHNYGYAVGVFYPDFFLLIPAMFRIIGFTVEESYKILIFLFHVFTIWIAYRSFYHISKRSKIAIVVAVAYTLSPYRLLDIYYRGALGEFQAITFLPWILSGLYLILKNQTKIEEKQKGRLQLILGFSGLLLCHVLSCEMAGVFTLLCCLFYCKRVLQEGRLWILCQSALLILVINLGYIVPFLDYFKDNNVCVNDGSRDQNTIQQNGVVLQSIFRGFYQSKKIFDAKDMPVYLGLFFFIALGLAAFSFVIYLNRYIRKKRSAEKVYLLATTGIACALSIWMISDSFPYNFFKKIWFLNKMIISIQFPWRFFVITVLLCSFLLCLQLKYIVVWNSKIGSFVLIFIAVLSAVVGIQFEYGAERELNDRSFYVDRNGINSFSQGAGEYILSGTDIDYYNRCYVYNTDGCVSVTGYDLQKTKSVVTCKNEAEVDGMVTIPKMAYRGYVAKDIQTGKTLEVTKDDNNSLQVVVPAGYQGTFEVSFHEFWYWRVAEGISLIFVVGMIVNECRKKRTVYKQE